MTEKKESKMNLNYWMMVSLVLFVALIVVFVLSGGNFKKQYKVTAEEAEQIVLDFVEEQGVTDVEVIGTAEDQDFFKTEIKFQGQQIPVFLTKDGKRLTAQLIDLEEVAKEKQLEETREAGFSEEQNLAIKEFAKCLDEKGIKVYTAGWCGHCAGFISYFGGHDNFSPINVECSDADHNPTDQAEICQEENIMGYPTIKFQGEEVSIPRTFDALSQLTGCTAPQV